MLAARYRRVVLAVALCLLVASPASAGPAQPGGAGDACPSGAVCDALVMIDPGARFHLLEHLGASAATTWHFGNPSDEPLYGDWDCDGVPSPAMYRASNGFVYLRNDTAAGPADEEFFFGDPGDVPLAGDFDGDGCDTISIYRPAEATMYVTNRLGTGNAEYAYLFGNVGDRPFVADFDGDGIDTLGLHRPSTGYVYFRNSHRSGAADFEFFYGDPGDAMLAGDWNGDGRDTLAVHRPGERKVYFRMSNTPGRADVEMDVLPGAIVLPARAPAGLVAPSGLDDPFDAAWQSSVGARVDRAAVSVEFVVDGGHPAASDANPGTPEAPLATIGGALDRAQDRRRVGDGVRIVVGPGVYRERLEVVGPNLAGDDPVLVITAAEPGTVTVSGADPWTGWQPAGGGQWTAPWPYDWGLAPIPAGWESVTVNDIVRRREMVIVDGDALAQVERRGDLRPGTFLVDEAADLLTVQPADPGSFASAVVEVAVRPEAMRILLTDHVVVAGVRFVHSNAALDNAVQVLESSDVVLEDVAVEWNNWGGVQIFDSTGVTLTALTASHNGGRGIGMADARSVLLDGVALPGNNWRGAAGGFTGWSVAGMKVHHLNDALFRDVTANGNQTRGLWLDTDNVRVLITRAQACGNQRDGVFVEATQGPVQLEETVLCDNDGHGLLSANATDLRLVATSICGNALAQIELSGLPERTIDRQADGGTMNLPAAADWAMLGSHVDAASGSSTLVGTTLGAADMGVFASGLIADANTWSSPVPEAFELRDGSFGQWAEWRSLTGEGPGSSFDLVGGDGCGR